MTSFIEIVSWKIAVSNFSTRISSSTKQRRNTLYPRSAGFAFFNVIVEAYLFQYDEMQ